MGPCSRPVTTHTPSGSAANYADCYQPTWGRHKARTKPALGNHEYDTANATGYFGYFGSVAGQPEQGYYSFDVSGWHVVVLNSNCAQIGGCGTTSPQTTWLRNDLTGDLPSPALHLEADDAGRRVRGYVDGAVQRRYRPCHQRSLPRVRAVRAPEPGRTGRRLVRDPRDRRRDGRHRPRDLRQLHHGEQRTEERHHARGLKRVTLHPTSYDFQFVPIAGESFCDSGTGSCHGKPGSAQAAAAAGGTQPSRSSSRRP